MAERRQVELDGRAVVLVDSVTQIEAGDAGQIVITGSHGGASSASFAIAVPARLYVFNDAGVGKDEAGIAALALLQAAGVAACAVGHDSARIGDAGDTLENGVITHANGLAQQVGFVDGRVLKMALVGGAAI